MRIIGCDLHARQQTLAVLDTTTGEVMEKTLTHSGTNVEEFYSTLPGPVRVGIEATGTMQWFLSLMEELGIGPKRPGEGESGCRSQTRAPRVWAALCRTVSKGKSPQRSNLL